MKKIILTLSIALSCANVFAAETNPLKEHMEQMDKAYKAVVKQINNTAQNPSSIQMFLNLEKLTYECIIIMPSRADLWTGDADARLKQILYQRMLGQLFAIILDGEEALWKNDNAAAKTVLTKMAELKFQGHQIFKP